QRASRDDEDFALVLAIEHVLHGGTRVLQRKRSVDDGPETSGHDVVEDLLELEDRPEVRPDDTEVLRVNVAKVEAPPVRVVGADGDERAHASQRVRRAFERVAADVLDDDVHAALAGPPLRLCDAVLPAAIAPAPPPEPPRR